VLKFEPFRIINIVQRFPTVAFMRRYHLFCFEQCTIKTSLNFFYLLESNMTSWRSTRTWLGITALILIFRCFNISNLLCSKHLWLWSASKRLNVQVSGGLTKEKLIINIPEMKLHLNHRDFANLPFKLNTYCSYSSQKIAAFCRNQF